MTLQEAVSNIEPLDGTVLRNHYILLENWKLC